MEAIRDMMITLLAMSALNQLAAVFAGHEESRENLRIICGLGAAMCMLNAYRAMMGILG